MWLLATHPLLALAGLFGLDGLGLPLLPEVAALLVFGLHPMASWGVAMLAVIAAAETVAAALLCLVVRATGLPPRLQRFMAAYAGMLVGRDERLLLVNRFVPVLPAAGAFIHAANWRPGRSLAFIALGSVVKYGLLLGGSALAFRWLPSRDATFASLGAAAVFITVSGLLALRRRLAQREEPAASA